MNQLGRTTCRFCSGKLRQVLDLGHTPVANALAATREEALAAERYPLVLTCCKSCGLYQLDAALDMQTLFPADYVYATPKSEALSRHYGYAIECIQTTWPSDRWIERVVEIGSNNGEFLAAWGHGFDRIGVEPCVSVAKLSEERGIRTIVAPFTETVAREIAIERHDKPDVIVARHCFAHIDDVHEVMRGVKSLLHPRGVFYIENAYVVDTMAGVQFDQLYHEHMSYLGVLPMQKLLAQYDMELFWAGHADVHGGSIMMMACHRGSVPVTSALRAVEHQERVAFALGLEAKFVERVQRAVAEVNSVCWTPLSSPPHVDAYGASAKGATLLNVSFRLSDGRIASPVRCCVDNSPLKQGKFMPGVGTPIVSREEWKKMAPPDYLLLTAWNYEDEIRRDEAAFAKAGGKFIVPLPEARVA